MCPGVFSSCEFAPLSVKSAQVGKTSLVVAVLGFVCFFFNLLPLHPLELQAVRADKPGQQDLSCSTSFKCSSAQHSVHDELSGRKM